MIAEKRRETGTFCTESCTIIITIKNNIVMDDMIYRNNSIAEENIDPTATRQRTDLKNGAKGVVERNRPRL